MLLAIDTSTRHAGVCVRDQDRVVRSLTWHSTQNHTRELLPAIETVLRHAGGGIASVEAVAVASGPGGFSALRVGMSVAKGIAMPKGLPVVAVGTLECEAYPYASTGLLICPLLDVGRNEVATAQFRQQETWTQVAEARICALDDLGDLALLAPLVEDQAGSVVVCGEGVAAHEEQVRQALGSRALVMAGNPSGRLWALAELGWRKLTMGQTEDLVTLQPFYLRRPTIGRPATPRHVIN